MPHPGHPPYNEHMDPTQTTSHILPPTVGGLDTSRVDARTGGARDNTLSGNQLLGLDVWGQTHASDRSLGSTATASAFGGSLEQVVDYILAPLS